MTRLLVLHGFTQNGAALRAHMEPLLARLPDSLELDFPDAPHACSPASVARMHARIGDATPPGPYRCWRDASDDGLQYRGFDETRALLTERASRGPRVGMLGFSQGAIAASAFAALAAHGQFPHLDFVILVAGRTPRAEQLAPLFGEPLALPSLHVCGTRDPMREPSARLAEAFDPGQRETASWMGPHVVPTRGSAADAIASFLARQAAR